MRWLIVSALVVPLFFLVLLLSDVVELGIESRLVLAVPVSIWMSLLYLAIVVMLCGWAVRIPDIDEDEG